MTRNVCDRASGGKKKIRRLAGLTAALFLLAAPPAALLWRTALPVQASEGTGTAGTAPKAQSVETLEDGRAEAAGDTLEAGTAGTAPKTQSTETLEDGRAKTASDDGSSGSSARTAAGTAILLGAGAYTGMRMKWKEKKKQQQEKQEYVYFENHTRNGTLRREERE